jgi:antitoxin CcdA
MHMSDAHNSINLTINKDLLREAKELGINLSATLERALVQDIRNRRRTKWIAENAEAIDAYNEDVRKNGVFSDGRRVF